MAKQKEDDALSDEPTMTQVLARLAAIQEGNQAVQKAQLKQTAPRSNQSGPKISAFNPRGEKDYPMPVLKCEVHMPFPQTPNAHGFDREEVELMNQVVPGEYPVELNDGSILKINIIGRKNHATGAIESLSFSGPIDPDTHHPTPLFTASNKQQFPQLRTILRQIIGEEVSAGVLTIAAERRKVASGELAISLGE